jgi:hypothetical protein
MKKLACLGLVGMFLMADPGGSGTVEERKPERASVTGFGQLSFADRFEGRKRALAMAIGNGRSYLGLYVFDRRGNCVAWDDYSGSVVGRDDLAVEWYPPETADYDIEVHNFSAGSNNVNFVIR